MGFVYAMVRVDPSISVDNFVAGRSYDIHLSLGSARVTLPIDQVDTAIEYVDERSGWPPFPGVRLPIPLRALGSDWSVQAWDRPVRRAAELGVQALSFRIEVPDEAMRDGMFPISLLNGVQSWLAIVRDWLGAWIKAPQQHEIQFGLPSAVIVYQIDGAWHRSGSRGSPPPVVLPGLPLVTPEQLRAAFLAASAILKTDQIARSPLTLSLEYQIIARAYLNCLRGDFRGAVIDACCAAEVAMGGAVSRALANRGTDQSTMRNITEKTGGIVETFRLYLLARQTSISVGRVMDQLSRPRNDAAHAGKDPTDEDVQRAFKTSRAILDEANPLPSPDDLARFARKLIKADQVHSGIGNNLRT